MLFYLSNRDGGFDVFNGRGDLIVTVSTEDIAQAIVDVSKYPDAIIVIGNGQFIGAYETSEQAELAIRQLKALNEAVGPTKGSTKH